MQEPFADHSEDLNLTGTIINEDDILDDYEPSEREINSYAMQLGMDPTEDQEYLYLAKEGLKAAIPKPWTACRTKDGKIFYYNFETEESQWEHPLDQAYKEKFVEVKQHHTKSSNSMSPISINIQTTTENHVLENNTEHIEFTAESPVAGFGGIDSLEFSDIQSQSIDIQKNLYFEQHKKKHQVKQEGEKKSNGSSNSAGENLLDKAIVGMDDDSENQEELSEKIFGEYFDTEGAWQRTDGDERTPGDSTLKEIEIESLQAFQKYEDDLKSQFSYVISQFEQNYQKNAAKIEEQYQKELKKIEMEQEIELNQSYDLEDEMKNFETVIRQQHDKDLKGQITDLNKGYENMRKHMEEKAEAEIHQCLEDVREKWKDEIKEINKAVVHRRTKSASIKPEVPEFQLDNRRSSWGYVDSVKANSSLNFNRLGQEILYDFGKDCEGFARDVQKSLKNEIKVIDVEKQEYKKSMNHTKSVMEKHYKQKFEENKQRIQEQYAEEISSYNSSDSFSCSIPEESEMYGSIKGRGAGLLKQLNAIKQPNRHQKQEKEHKIHEELKQLEEDIFYREEYVGFMNQVCQKTSLVTKDLQAKEKATKVLEKEINEIEKEINSLKKQLKIQQSSLDQLKQQEIEKDHISLKSQTISSKIEKVEKEIETIKNTTIHIQKEIIDNTRDSDQGLFKILHNIKEIKELAVFFYIH